MTINALIMATRGFQSLNIEVQGDMLRRGLERVNEKTDFIVFDPKAEKERFEDGRRTLILPNIAQEKVYAKLDDFGSAEVLSENYGKPVNTSLVVTFMLAEEY